MNTMLENVAMFEALRRQFAEKYTNGRIGEKSANRAYIYLNAAYALISAISDIESEEDKEAMHMLENVLKKVNKELRDEKN